MAQPYELTVSQAVQQIKEKKLSPVDLARSLLDRIDATDKDLKAWVTIDREEVLSNAKEREEEARQGKSLGLLHGVPVGLKDIFYTAGIKTAAGSKVYADFVPEFDATSVAKIKEAGGIILGKAVTTEFATSDPSPTYNPWNFEHTPGGSSSGSSVAVATKTVGAALGSQTGGSTCRPAAYNGIVGLKATYGRISRYGVVPVSWSLDHVGILVRTVEDAALMLQVMSGEDPNDPGSSSEPVPDFMKEMIEHNRPPRIGIVSQYYSEKSTEEVWAHTKGVAQRLAAAGAEVINLGLPDSFKTAHSAQRIVMNVECAAFHEQFHATQAEEYGPPGASRHGDGHAGPGHQVPASPAASPPVPQRYGPDGAAGGRGYYAGHSGPGPQGPEHHRRRCFPGALDHQRPADRHPAIGTERRRDAPGGAVGWAAL